MSTPVIVWRIGVDFLASPASFSPLLPRASTYATIDVVLSKREGFSQCYNVLARELSFKRDVQLLGSAMVTVSAILNFEENCDVSKLSRLQSFSFLKQLYSLTSNVETH